LTILALYSVTAGVKFNVGRHHIHHWFNNMLMLLTLGL